MYKLVAIDIDGTLVKNDKTLSEETKKIIRQICAKGVKVVITTGRSIDRIQEFVKELGLEGEEYVIANNGCSIYSTTQEKPIYEKTVTGRDFKEVYRCFKKEGTTMEAHLGTEYLIEEDLKTVVPNDWRITSPAARTVDFMKELGDDDKLVKFLLFSGKEMLDELYGEIQEVFGDRFSIVRSMDHMCEFMQKGCHKGSGITELARILGIKQEEIIAIGDELNDMEMIEYAGMGIAMGNAKDELKEIANYITKTNEEDGVAYALDKFILKGKNYSA
ncbi:MAG: Cof-type HAD-IIB family hydrolase [Clostridiaceae bacterium]